MQISYIKLLLDHALGLHPPLDNTEVILATTTGWIVKCSYAS
jgi:hypothetical protein